MKHLSWAWASKHSWEVGKAGRIIQILWMKKPRYFLTYFLWVMRWTWGEVRLEKGLPSITWVRAQNLGLDSSAFQQWVLLQRGSMMEGLRVWNEKWARIELLYWLSPYGQVSFVLSSIQCGPSQAIILMWELSGNLMWDHECRSIWHIFCPSSTWKEVAECHHQPNYWASPLSGARLTERLPYTRHCAESGT